MGPLMMRNPTTQEVLPIKGNLIRHISDSLVVTINKDGSSLSTFGDDIWNYKATSTSLRTINFNSKIEQILPVDGGEEASESSFANSKDFLKTFTLHWISAVGGCSMSKLNGDLSGISFLIRYCLDSGIPMREIFSTPNGIDFLIERVSTPKQIGIFLGKIQRITCTSTALSNNPFWAGLKTSVEFDNKLIRARKTYPETSDTVKTLVIPSEIYQSVLKRTIEDLDRFLDHEDSIKYIFSMRALTLDEVRRLDRKLGSDKISKQSQSSIVSSYWAKLVKKNVSDQ